jgi:hypothetical protein
MGTAEEPDVWPRTIEISFGKVEVSRHDFYNCFEPEGVVDSAFDAVVRLPGRTICIFRVGFKSDEDHQSFVQIYSQKQSVKINGKEVAIRMRDRTLNLVRVRVHNFKFSDDLGGLETRLRQYGKVNKLAWDTYQDKQLPKWSGIKTGVVNVDMEIVSNIPSYINFGSYKHPLMVEYAGQTKTCRLCDSPCHVSSYLPHTAEFAPERMGCSAGLVMAQVSLVCSRFGRNWQRVLDWAPCMWLATGHYSFNPVGCIISMRPGKSVPDWRRGIFALERCLYAC